MVKSFSITFILLALLLSTALAQKADLPLPGGLQVTLREADAPISLPTEPGCGGRAAATLNCRTFVVDVESHRATTIRIGMPTCPNPWIRIQVRDNDGSPWMPANSSKANAGCSSKVILEPLKPRDRFEYVITLHGLDMSLEGSGFVPGSYSVRAVWTFYDCEEEEGNDNCLEPKQIVTVTSNELKVTSPEIKNLGEVKLAFEVSFATPDTKPITRKDSQDIRGPSSDFEKLPFHYIIRNLGADPVKNMHLDCGDSWIRPEYQLPEDDWKPLPYKPSRYDFCSLNVLKVQTIFPGKTAEGEFTLSTLDIRFDTTSIESSGGHIRFVLTPNACVTSDDGSFCLTRTVRGKPVLSNALQVMPTEAPHRVAPLP